MRDQARLGKSAFRRLDEEVKRFLTSQKSDSFRSNCESLSPSARLGIIWRAVRSMSVRRSSVCSGVTNSLDSSEFRTMQDELVQPQCVPADLPKIETIDESDLMNAPFTLQEFSAALASCGARISLGLDGVEYRVVRELSSFSQEFLLTVFNRMFRDSSFPKSWRNTLVVFIPKTGTGKFHPSRSRQPYASFLRGWCRDGLNVWRSMVIGSHPISMVSAGVAPPSAVWLRLSVTFFPVSGLGSAPSHWLSTSRGLSMLCTNSASLL